MIELLIVIAIIGLLASIVLVGLSGFRKSGRDARRLADLKQLQVVVERYLQKCGVYPMTGPNAPPGTSGCPVQSTGTQANKWLTEFQQELVDANMLDSPDQNQFPQDPLAKGQGAPSSEDHPFSYKYGVALTPPGSEGSRYILRARLEDSANPALLDDIDGDNLYGSGVECADGSPPDGPYYYCVGF